MKVGVIFIIILLFFIGLLIFSIMLVDDQDLVEEKINEEYENPEFEVLVENLDVPWALDFLPSGDLIFTERGGKVKIFDGFKVEEVGIISVSEVSESGLLGIAVDPDFSNNNLIYLYYTNPDGENQVSKFILDLEMKIIGNEVVLLGNIPSARFHDGGRIKFGPDGDLYVTTGDATKPEDSQELNSLAGKILRMSKDGTIPDDNPFGNLVWSYGHRNPQGIAWDDNGVFYAVEHGPSRNDEVNIIHKGGNYGWPEECSDQNEIGTILPLRCYTEFTLAPSDIAYYDDSLYVGGLKGNQLRKLKLSGGNIASEEILIDNIGRIREVVVHEEFLYIATSNKDGRGDIREGDDKILRFKL